MTSALLIDLVCIKLECPITAKELDDVSIVNISSVHTSGSPLNCRTQMALP